nr:plasmid replication initiator TrfA [Vandammella animalimorsus]
MFHRQPRASKSPGYDNYRVWVNPSLIVLFAGNTFTSHVWDAYHNLSLVARRQADYIESP